MASIQATITVEAQITLVKIDPIGPRLLLEGVLLDTERGKVLREFSEDVTSLLTPTQLQQVQSIATRAQSWADGKLSNL